MAPAAMQQAMGHQSSAGIADQDCAVRYQLAGKTLAIATMGRDRENLDAELAMERAAYGAK